MRKIVLIGGFLLAFTHGFSCSLFKKTENNLTLVGNNEDNKEPIHYIWTRKASCKSFGVVYYARKTLLTKLTL